MLDLLKKIFFWSQIRRCLIIRKHKKTSKYCRRLINEYFQNGVHYKIIPKKDFKKPKIIWQYWGQGYDDPNMPEIVKICLESVIRYKPEDCVIVRLSDDNMSEYLDLPDFLRDNASLYSRAHFSDILRVLLLTTYGGCWLDATVLLTGPIQEQYWNRNIFLFQRDENEPGKVYWEDAYAYYYGWGRKFKVRMLNSVIFAKSGNPILHTIKNIMLSVFSTGEPMPDYFFFQILFNELVENEYKEENCPIESDCIPHYMQQFINDERFNLLSINQILAKTTIHKLTYKNKDMSGKILNLLYALQTTDTTGSCSLSHSR